MDIRQLYDRSLAAPLTQEEMDELHAMLEKYPYCSVLYSVQARASSAEGKFRELATVYARDRNRLNAYLSVGVTQQTTETLVSASPTASSEEVFFDRYASQISWRLDTFVNIWIERTRQRTQEVVDSLKVNDAHNPTVKVPLVDADASPSMQSPDSSEDISSWVQKIAASVRHQTKESVAPAVAETSLTSSTTSTEAISDSPAPTGNSTRFIDSRPDKVDHSKVEAERTANVELGGEIKDTNLLQSEIDESFDTEKENWRERVPNFVQLDVKPEFESEKQVSSKADPTIDNIDQKALQLENDIKARIRRAKDLLRRSATPPVGNAQAKDLIPRTNVPPDSSASLDTLRSNIRLIHEVTHTEEQSTNQTSTSGSGSRKLKSDYEPERFLDRFIVPNFDPKSQTLSAYREFLTHDSPESALPAEQASTLEIASPQPVSRTTSFSRFVEPRFDAKADTLQIPPRLPDIDQPQELDTQPELANPESTVLPPELQPLINELAVESRSQQMSSSGESGSLDLGMRLRTESFSRFIEPEFDQKIKTNAESIPISLLNQRLKQDDSGSSTLIVTESTPEPSVSVEAPTEKPAIGPIEPSRSESFSRFIEPEFSTAPPAKTPEKPAQVVPEPTAEASAEKPTSGPIEPTRSESFSRFIEPEFSPAPPAKAPEKAAQVAPEPPAEARAEKPASGPIEPLRSESFSRFIEPEFSTAPPAKAPDKAAQVVSEPIAEAPAEKPASGPIEPLRSDSFSRFIEPEFSTAPPAKAPEKPAQVVPEPTAEAPAEKPTSGPIEPLRSESFSRFIEPEFSTAPPTKAPEKPAQVVPEPTTEAPAEKPASGPIEPLRSESFSRFIEPEFSTAPPAKAPEKTAEAAPEPTESDTLPVSSEDARPVSRPASVDLEKLQRIASEVARTAEEKMRSETQHRKAATEISPEGVEAPLAATDEPSLQPVSEVQALDVLAAQPMKQPEAVDEILPAEKLQEASLPQPEPAIELQAIDAPSPDYIPSSTLEETAESTVLKYPHGDLTIEIRLKPDQLKYFRSFDLASPRQQKASTQPRLVEDNPEPIVSPELIKRRFEEQQRTQTGGASGTLEKVIIDYAQQTIEFVVEPTAANESALPGDHSIPEASGAVSIPLDNPPPAALEVAPPSYDPADIRSQVPDYSEFLLKALSFKDHYSESEARTFLKLIYNRTEIKSPDFLEQTFDLPRILPVSPSLEPTAEDLRTSRDLIEKLSNLDMLYDSEESSSTVSKEVSAEDAQDLEHTSNEIDSRIDRFRSNLQRIRTKSSPSESSISLIQDRYLSSLLSTMLEEFESAERAPVADPKTDQPYSLDDVPHLDSAQGAGSTSIDHVLSTYGSFEPILQAQIDRLRTREPELADLDDFSIEDDSEDVDELPSAVCTESMARLLAQQGNFRKAEAVYRSLQLKYPEKSDYFAAEIERLNGKQTG